LVQAAEADFSYEQFERFVFPNLRSKAVRRWLSNQFTDGHITLSTVTIEIAELRSGVSKLHARVANYHDLSGERVKFKAITNGIDIQTWTHPEIVDFYKQNGVLDKFDLPAENFAAAVDKIEASDIRRLKAIGRAELNRVLAGRKDQYGRNPIVDENALVFDFKRRFVDYKRPWLPFTDADRLAKMLDKYNIHYFLAGRVHEGDHVMAEKLKKLLDLVDANPILRERVHYLPDYDEELGRALSIGANVSINTPIVGLEACGTSWMKDVANLSILVSTHDGGVADCPSSSYLSISGKNEAEEVESLYSRMEEAARAWSSDFDLEMIIASELKNYMPVVSGSRMLKDYLDFLF
jgi:starch phosphorylase